MNAEPHQPVGIHDMDIKAELARLRFRRAELMAILSLREEVNKLEFVKGVVENDESHLRIFMEEVSLEFNLSLRELKTRRRFAVIVLPRHIVFYLARELSPATTCEAVGNYFGKHHSTVLHGTVAIKDRMNTDQEFRIRIDRLKNKCTTRLNAPVTAPSPGGPLKLCGHESI